MRVRIIEDNPDLAQVLEVILREHGITYLTTTTQFDYLLSVNAWEGIDACILDLMLGGGTSGITILKFLHQNELDIKVVVLSAVADLGAMTNDLRTLGAIVLSKPTSVETIVRALVDDDFDDRRNSWYG